MGRDGANGTIIKEKEEEEEKIRLFFYFFFIFSFFFFFFSFFQKWGVIKKSGDFLPGIDHITGNIGCDCPAVKLMVDWRHDCCRYE